MPVQDRNLKRDWRSIYVAAVDFSSARGVSATPAIASPTTTNDLAEINSLGVFGVAMDNADDLIRHLLVLPWDVDYGHPIYVRVHWTSGSATTADTVTWAVTRKSRSPNNDALTATIDTALDTAIAQDTVPAAVAYTLCRTLPGKINANSVRPNEMHEIQLKLTQKAVGLSEALFALGVEFLYVPMLSGKAGTGKTPALPSDWLI